MSLCPEAEMRASMTDAEFWEHVFGGAPMDLDEAWDEFFDQIAELGECRVCGGTGPCGYDADGRPMMHLDDHDD